MYSDHLETPSKLLCYGVINFTERGFFVFITLKKGKRVHAFDFNGLLF